MKHLSERARAAGGFSALAHETRLTVFEAVMSAGPEGVTAGELAQIAEVTPSNLSAHLNILSNSGLITVRRDGRRRYYSPDLDEISRLVEFLVDTCCSGHPEICASLPGASGARKSAND